MSEVEVAIIGAGPYGLSAAAHLKAQGIAVRVFGKPMDFWATKMAAGMLLRSPRIASNISDPSHGFALPAYEMANGIAPLAPLPLPTFVDYGQWFQRKLMADLDTREVASVDRFNGGFRTVLTDGTSVTSDRVVVAAGIGPFQRIPPAFQNLSSEQVSHCHSGTDVKAFSGKRVVVIGAGQSALESAALLHEAGAEVEIVMRQGEMRWIGGHPWLHELGPISSLMYSQHDVGPAGISRMVAMPNLMRRLPPNTRDKMRKRAVRPAGSQWLRPRLTTVKVRIGRHVTAAARTFGPLLYFVAGTEFASRALVSNIAQNRTAK